MLLIGKIAVFDKNLGLSLTALVLGLIAATVMALRLNQRGIFRQGFAPPIKPLSEVF